jgi:hypothetical protein
MEHTVSSFPPANAPRSEADLPQIKSRLGGALHVNSYTEVSLYTSDIALTCLSDMIFPCRVSTRRLSIDASKQVASSCPTMQWTATSASFQSRVQG